MYVRFVRDYIAASGQYFEVGSVYRATRNGSKFVVRTHAGFGKFATVPAAAVEVIA